MADEYDFDLITIGGGSGGLASSRRAAALGAKVLLLDFVKPSPAGTSWGLGGTCVNVGCIPKKLYHTGTLLRESIHDAREYGWEAPEELDHDWSKLQAGISDYIGGLNWGYRVKLREEGITYKNAMGRLLDAHTVETTDKKDRKKTYTGKNILIAVGGRPWLPDDVEGIEHVITSDDVFRLENAPGKTLVVGASYVALECAGYLNGYGYDTTVMVRSILLRGFDQDIAEHIGAYMERTGTKFIRPAVPNKIEKQEDGRLKVTWTNRDDGAVGEDVFDTVLYAAGRRAETGTIGLQEVGVEMDNKGKIVVDEGERSSVDNIYAIGDVIDQLELTPVAIQAGRLLANRMFGGKTKLMNYEKVATTVFTPIEYGAIGLSEEAAYERFGADNVEVYLQYDQPLEWTVAHRPENDVYSKLIVTKDDDKVVGLHYVGPHAGEVVQGYSVAINLGATKDDFDNTVGIHPTTSEVFTDMDITRASGKDPKKTGC